MSNFTVAIYNPITRKTERTVKLQHEVFAEDTWNDVMLKIWSSCEIPPWRQHLYTSSGWSPYQVLIDGIVFPVELPSFFDLRTHESEIVLSGVPISKYATERKEEIVIDTDRMYCPVGRTRHVNLVDLNSIITPDFVDEQDLKREAYLYDLVFHGCVVLFWPLVTFKSLKESFTEPDELIETPLNVIKSQLDNMQKIAKDVSKYSCNACSTAILATVFAVDPGVRRVNLRVVFDWLATSAKVPCIMAYLQSEDATRASIYIKKHASYESSIDEYVNRVKVMRNFRKTKEFVEIVMRKDCAKDTSCAYMTFRLFADNTHAILNADFRETEHSSIQKTLDGANALLGPMLHAINEQLGSVALPYGGRLDKISDSNIVSKTVRMCFYWKRILPLSAFLELKEKLKTLERAGVLQFKPEECSHNSYVQDNCFIITFLRGIASKTGVDVKVSLRTTDIRVELMNARSMRETEIVQHYLTWFFDTYGKKDVAKEALSDVSKMRLKTLREKDPVLYDLKRYDPKAKVYSVLCQSERQPTLYTPDETKLLSKSKRDRLYKFWNFTTQTPAYYDCASAEYPYLSFKVGKHPSGYCLPCCRKSEAASEESLAAKVEEQCFKTYSYTDYESASSHILSYGKDIPLGRIGRLPHALTADGLFLYGVHQDTPAAQNVGLVFSIAAALGKDFFRDAAKKIVELGDEYRVLGYGVAGTFSSATDLADEVLSVFDQKVDGFSVLTSEQWTDVFLTLASRLFGLSVLVYVSTESDSVELNEDTDLDSGGDSSVLLVVRNKAGHFPVFAAEDKGGTDLRPLQISEAEAARELRKKLRELVDAGSAGLFNPLEALEKFCDKTRRKVRAKLIDTRDLCYGVLLEESGSLVYLPVRYSLHHKYFANAEVISGVRPAGSYPYEALMRFLDELNAFSAASKQGAGAKLLAITPEYYVQNVGGRYFGFKSGKLYYFFDPTDSVRAASAPPQLLPFDPREVDSHITCNRALLVDPKSVTRLEYRNRLYRLLVSEFVNKLKKERNQAMRKQVEALIKKARLNSSADYQAFYDSVDSLDISEDDRRDIKVAVSRTKDSRKALDFVRNTIFDFDYTTLRTLERLDADAANARVEKLVAPMVVLVDDDQIPVPNIIVPCTNDRRNAPVNAAYCAGSKLKVAREYYAPFVRILTDNIKNGTVLYHSQIFNLESFIDRPGESITVINK
jgi:hypothetical protein